MTINKSQTEHTNSIERIEFSPRNWIIKKYGCVCQKVLHLSLNHLHFVVVCLRSSTCSILIQIWSVCAIPFYHFLAQFHSAPQLECQKSNIKSNVMDYSLLNIIFTMDCDRRTDGCILQIDTFYIFMSPGLLNQAGLLFALLSRNQNRTYVTK